MTTDHELSGAHGDQLAIGQLLPIAGDRYQNCHTDSIGTVESVETRRRTWVKLRRDGRTTTIPLSELEQHWQPYRPPAPAV